VKYLEEFRDPELAQSILNRIQKTVTRPWTIMEVCGGQTHSIVRNGIDQLLPEQVELIHGPGCPVCVTGLETIDRAIHIAGQSNVMFTSFGDMLRVPGSESDLFRTRSSGADVRIVYSPLDAVQLARENPDRQVVFFAVGFETTAPNAAMAVWKAKQEGLHNFSLLVSHVLVPPAIEALVSDEDNRIQAFLLAGHVCAVAGFQEYEALAERYEVPMVVTGFEPVDILEGILEAGILIESGAAAVTNRYARVVRREGNPRARQLLAEVFEVCDRQWRGIGVIPQSGYRLRPEFRSYDAEQLFAVDTLTARESSLCISGQILQGKKKPPECPAFGRECTPQKPLGATMVSSEGACTAYYAGHRYRSIARS